MGIKKYNYLETIIESIIEFKFIILIFMMFFLYHNTNFLKIKTIFLKSSAPPIYVAREQDIRFYETRKGGTIFGVKSSFHRGWRTSPTGLDTASGVFGQPQRTQGLRAIIMACLLQTINKS